MKKALSLMLCILLITAMLNGCATVPTNEEQQYTATFLTLFDTVTTVIGKDVSQEAFQEKAQAIHDGLEYYHKLFDIYNDYEGIHNLKTVNDNAGKEAVAVDEAIICFLMDCKSYWSLTEGLVNPAMGSVLHLWHEAREQGLQDPENASLPSRQALEEAANHRDMNDLVIDEAASTVYIADPQMQLDVGAIAKGWAVQKVAGSAPAGMLISVGGNVCVTGPKDTTGTPWVIGIQDPDKADRNLHTVHLTQGSIVTSGDYQRRYWVDETAYHHIIDPQTLMPGQLWRAVSILCSDSGLADVLSTALFLMDKERGQALAQLCGAEVLWIAKDGQEYMTPGFADLLRS